MKFCNELRDALRSGNRDRVVELTSDNAMCCYKRTCQVFDDEKEIVFLEIEVLLDVLDLNEFQTFVDPATVLYRFEMDWAAMTENQRDRLLRHIQREYGAYGDPKTWFIMTELLGEYFADERACDVIEELVAGAIDERPRALLPHAFEHLVRDSAIDTVRDHARTRLKEGLTDWSEGYRGECALSIARIKRCGM